MLALVVASALFVVPAALADDDDDLERWKNKVEKKIEGAEHDLHRSSKKVQRLNGKLSKAEGRLRASRSRLDNVRTQLHQARAKSDRVTAQLRQAEQRLEQVSAELEQAREEVSVQRGEVRTTVTDLATDGDPRVEALTSMLDSGSLEELMIKRTAGELVVNTQFRSLEDLEAAEEAMTERKQQVKQARNAVASKKRQADRLVSRKRDLVGEAATVKKRVRSLVTSTAKARKWAETARNHDRIALQRLQKRERSIRRKILAARGANGRFRGNPDGYLRRPSNGAISSPFGYRTHPIYGYRGLHNGTDFAASCGSPLYAGSDGKVVHAYYDQVYGYRLYLDIGRVNGNRITLVYNHMRGLRASAGATFARGDVVGRVGTTGWSTGCHLHFTVLRNGKPVDPMGYL
ncbi:peptidoglycan DD-metalloendopeptidase family protein [Nocardioides panacisoli]|uniref:peptidoglycan DD-metalloendopeptidase family protein n=1 Tax=Nocardioides panacisoli TaxID=627624 RepID=UPI001C62F5A4|nr:M23 family metallopeptidase [Nocardioides panacisoli]QYJ04251.1 peptidoglycan DD-metalloendopeptidase family protein [Nocardioides panacisoli]